VWDKRVLNSSVLISQDDKTSFSVSSNAVLFIFSVQWTPGMPEFGIPAWFSEVMPKDTNNANNAYNANNSH